MNSISIIMATYNRGYIISKAIDSVIHQTYKDFQLVIVDDGSTDDTESVVAGYEDKRIFYLKQQKNVGGNFARNVGIEHAQGDYIAFLDSDNMWKSDYLESAVTQIEKEKTELFFCRTKIHSADGECIFPDLKHSKDELGDYDSFRKLLCFGNVIDLNALVVEKKLLEEIGFFDTSLKRFQDYDLVVRLFEKNIKYSFVDKVLLDNYIQHDSISNRDEEFWNARLVIFRRQEEYCREKGLLYDLIYYFINTLLPKIPEENGEGKILHCLCLDDFLGIFGLLHEKDAYMDMLNEKVDNLNRTVEIKAWRIKQKSFLRGKRVAVYGYGDVGRDIVEQINEFEDVDLAGIYDRNFKELDGVSNPDEIDNEHFDYMIIAILNHDLCETVKKDMLGRGISDNKIVFFEECLW